MHTAPQLTTPTEIATMIVRAALIFVAGMLSSQASFAAECVVPRRCAAACEGPDPRTNPERIAPGVDVPITVSAKETERFPNGDLQLRDHVTLHQGDRQLRTDEIDYRQATNDFHIPGPVELSDSNLVLTGSGAQVDPAGAAQFDRTTFAIPARTGHGSAEHIRLSQDGELDLREVSYTTCPTPQPAWELKVKHLHIDRRASIGTGSGVRVDFKGVPILYLPYISFPVGNEPKSGFLAPEPGQSSRSGWRLSLPWYWRISDKEDATFTPTWYSSRGVDVGGEFRFLTATGKGQLNVNYLPDDRVTATDRTFVELNERTDLTSRLRFTASGVNIGDQAWFEDFGGATYTSIVALPRSAELVYRADEWSVLARALNYQIIDPRIAPADRPFTVLPQVVLYGYFPDRLFGITASIDGEFIAFQHGINGNASNNALRLDVQPQLRWPLRGHGIYVEPAVAYRYTSYRVDNPILPTGTSASTGTFNTVTLSRGAPIFSLDSGLTFEREFGVNGSRLETFEPRFLYAYVPFRDQSELPVFDTAPPDFNLIHLFETERYVGADRLGDINHVALGVTSRVLDTTDGQQFLSATVGELYRFSSQRVGLPGEQVDGAGASDLIGELDLSAVRNWNMHLGFQWDPNAQRDERTELGLQYRPGAGKVVNVGYRYRRHNSLASTITSSSTAVSSSTVSSSTVSATAGPVPDGLQQIDTSAAWPIGNAWSVYGRLVYSLKDSSAIERMGGFEYRSCCWGVRLLARRSVSSLTGTSDWEIKAQLELTGLSNVGNPVDAFLAQSIQGYSSARNDFSSTPVSQPQTQIQTQP